jgi:putative nucleotidyltransferase with HDIG domain
MTRSGTSVPAALKNVPPFPPVAVKLLALLSDPSVEMDRVAALLRTDATFTARLLQRVNSVEFGLTAPVSNVKEAVTLLGIDVTRHVTVNQATKLYAKEALKTEDLRRCWQHMVATAVLAEAIAEACGVSGSVPYTAGIMHDIGRLGLLMAFPREYEQVISHAAERCVDLLDYEAQEFGVHHAEAGRMLAEHWGLPEEFALITGRHHDSCEGGEVDLLRIVHLACRLADVFGYDFVHPLIPVESTTVLAELPAVARVRLEMAEAELRERIEARILEFDSDGADLPPRSSLDLLASPVPTQDSVSLVEERSETPAEDGWSWKKRLALAGGVAVVLAAAVLIWKLM